MSHASEHVTDTTVFRLRVSPGPAAITFGWDYPGATLLRVRILRSQTGFSETAGATDGTDDVEAAGARRGAAGTKNREGGWRRRSCPTQSVVYDDVTGSFRDTDVVAGTTYYYTVFARERVAARSVPAQATGSRGRVTGEAEWTLWAHERVRAATPRAARLRLSLARLLGRA
jgi:hypothetical protein